MSPDVDLCYLIATGVGSWKAFRRRADEASSSFLTRFCDRLLCLFCFPRGKGVGERILSIYVLYAHRHLFAYLLPASLGLSLMDRGGLAGREGVRVSYVHQY